MNFMLAECDLFSYATEKNILDHGITSFLGYTDLYYWAFPGTCGIPGCSPPVSQFMTDMRIMTYIIYI